METKCGQKFLIRRMGATTDLFTLAIVRLKTVNRKNELAFHQLNTRMRNLYHKVRGTMRSQG